MKKLKFRTRIHGITWTIGHSPRIYRNSTFNGVKRPWKFIWTFLFLKHICIKFHINWVGRYGKNKEIRNSTYSKIPPLNGKIRNQTFILIRAKYFQTVSNNVVLVYIWTDYFFDIAHNFNPPRNHRAGAVKPECLRAGWLLNTVNGGDAR